MRMNVEYIEVGRVCISRAGHDKGALYMICRVLDDRYVLVCDGKRRKLDSPKKKQVKHLKLTGQLAHTVAEKLRSEKKAYDFEIAGALEHYASSFTGKEG